VKKVPGSEFRVPGSERSGVGTRLSCLAISSLLVLKASTRNNGSLRETRNPEPGTRNPELGTRNRASV
jgi:hypothetical protein